MSKRQVRLYTREAKRTEAKDAASMLRLLRQLAAQSNGRALRNCDLMERGAKRVLRDHGYAEQQEVTDEEAHWPHDDAPQAVQLARKVLDGLPQLRRYAAKKEAAAAVGLEVGAAYERMRTVVCFGTEALVGAAVRKGGRKAGALKRAVAHDTDAQLIEAHKDLKKRYPQETQAQLQRRLGAQFGMSAETVRRHLYRLGLGRARRGRPPRSTAKTRP